MIDNDDFSDNRIAFQPVAEFLDAASDALRRERFVEHIMNERGLAGAADAGDHRKRSERNHQIQILEIVHVGTVEAEEFAGGFVAYVGNGDAQFAAEVATGERSMLFEHRRVRAGKQQLASKFAGPGTEILDLVGPLQVFEPCCRDRGGISKCR